MAGRSKRTNGEGTIRRLNNGKTWEMSVMEGVQIDGKPKFRRFYGPTQGAVKEQFKAYQMAKMQGIKLDKDYTFDEWSDIWYDNHKDSVSQATAENYKYILRTLKKHLGSKKIREVRAIDIEAVLKALMKEGRSFSSLTKARGLMYQVFERAEANDLILKNPVRFAAKMRYDTKPAAKEAFTAEEVTRLMNELPHDRIGNSIRIMLGTGMRTQELLALDPRNIEPDGSAVFIEQALKMARGSVTIGVPKTPYSKRRIPIPENLRGCAIALRNTNGTLIWESDRCPGQPVNPSCFRKQFRKALEAISGVRVLNPHSCRHSYTTLSQAIGIDLECLKTLTGHSSLKMVQHYIHIEERSKEKAVAKFNEAFCKFAGEPDKE